MGLVLRVTGVHVRYRERIALEDVSFEHPGGQRLGVIGPNGAGKSTLLKATVGLVRPQRGTVEVVGDPSAGGRGRIAYLPQRAQVDLEHPAQVRDVVAMGRYPVRGPIGRLRREDHERVRAAIERVGLAEHARTRIGELSGGQQQRAFLARAFAQQAPVLLLDEPYAGLDATTCGVIDRELARAAGEGVAVVVVNHDLVALEERYEQLLLLDRRVVAHGSPAEVLTEEALTRAYGPAVLLTRGRGADG
jgi:ABC-type Mn2+/Zn2+ transport system ATPase subunit